MSRRNFEREHRHSELAIARSLGDPNAARDWKDRSTGGINPLRGFGAALKPKPCRKCRSKRVSLVVRGSDGQRFWKCRDCGAYTVAVHRKPSAVAANHVPEGTGEARQQNDDWLNF